MARARRTLGPGAIARASLDVCGNQRAVPVAEITIREPESDVCLS